jgi:hypothetical protein
MDMMGVNFSGDRITGAALHSAKRAALPNKKSPALHLTKYIHSLTFFVIPPNNFSLWERFQKIIESQLDSLIARPILSGLMNDGKKNAILKSFKGRKESL